MKKNLLYLLLPLSFLANAEDNINKKLNVDLFLYSANDDFIKELAFYFKDKSITEGFKIKTNYSNLDILREQLSVKTALSKNVDGIIVNAVDPVNVAPLIDNARTKDKPIIFINRKPLDKDLLSYDKAYYVGTDSFNAGVLQAEIVNSYYNKHKEIDKNKDGVINYLLIQGEKDHQDTINRTKGLIKAFESMDVKYKNIDTIIANWSLDESYQKLSNYISNPQNLDKIEFIISNNDSMAEGAIKALSNIKNHSFKHDIPVIGVDGTTMGNYLVSNGQMIATVKNNSLMQAVIALKIIKIINDKEEVTKDKLNFEISNNSVLIPYSKIVGF